MSHHWNHAAWANAATKTHPSLIVGVFSPPHKVLVAHEVGSLIDHEAATLHPDGVAATEVQVKVCAVIAALIAPTLEVFVFVKNNLEEEVIGASEAVCFVSVKKKKEIKENEKTVKLGFLQLTMIVSRVYTLYLPYPWSLLQRFPMFSGLFIPPLNKHIIVIQIPLEL